MERRLRFNAEGERLAATLHLPDELRPGERRPGVILCNTVAAVKEMILPAFARGLARAGFAALAFDYRSFGESEGEPRCAARPWDQVEDARAAVTCLQQQPEVDPEAIAAFGAGLGGGVAIAAAAGDERIAAVATVAPVGDGERWLRALRSDAEWAAVRRRLARDRQQRARTGYSEYVTAVGTAGFALAPCDDGSLAFVERAYVLTPTLRRQLTLTSVAAIADFVPEALAARLAPRPLLLVAAPRDHLVPARETEAIYRRANEPKTVAYLPAGMVDTHYHLYDEPAVSAILQTVVDWLGAHLPFAAPVQSIAEAAAAAETPEAPMQAGVEPMVVSGAGSAAAGPSPETEGAASAGSGAAGPSPQTEGSGERTAEDGVATSGEAPPDAEAAATATGTAGPTARAELAATSEPAGASAAAQADPGTTGDDQVASGAASPPATSMAESGVAQPPAEAIDRPGDEVAPGSAAAAPESAAAPTSPASPASSESVQPSTVPQPAPVAGDAVASQPAASERDGAATEVAATAEPGDAQPQPLPAQSGAASGPGSSEQSRMANDVSVTTGPGAPGSALDTRATTSERAVVPGSEPSVTEAIIDPAAAAAALPPSPAAAAPEAAPPPEVAAPSTPQDANVTTAEVTAGDTSRDVDPVTSPEAPTPSVTTDDVSDPSIASGPAQAAPRTPPTDSSGSSIRWPGPGDPNPWGGPWPPTPWMHGGGQR